MPFNGRAQAIFGLSFRDVSESDVTRLYDDPQEPIRIARLLREAPTGTLSNHETAIRTRSGERVPIRLSAALLRDAHGERCGSVGYFEDLRESKQASRRLATLVDASNVIARSEDMSEGLEALAEMLARLVGGSYCRILLRDERARSLVVRAAYPPPEPAPIPAWDPALGERCTEDEHPDVRAALADGTPCLMSFERDEASGAAITPRCLDLPRDIPGAILLALRSGSRSIGLIQLGITGRGGAPGITEIEIASAVASQTAALIDRLRLHEVDERREQLLAKLHEALQQLRPERELGDLQREATRVAVDLVGFTAGCLFANHPRDQTVEVVATAGFPSELIGRREAHDDGLTGLVVQTAATQVVSDGDDGGPLLRPYRFKTVLGIAIPGPAGNVDAVLVVGAGYRQYLEVEREILERFAGRVAAIFQTSRLWNWEARLYGQLAVLRRLGDYMLGARDVDRVLAALLTAATAGYGLGFNRAAAFLIDEDRQHLVGRLGIGHFDAQEARREWEEHLDRGMEDVERYINHLEEHGHWVTPLDARVRDVRIRVSVGDLPPLLAQAVRDGGLILDERSQLEELPVGIVDALKPVPPMTIVPLVAFDQVLGFVFADNFVSRAHITSEDVDPLMRLANSAGLAIVNLRLLAGSEAPVSVGALPGDFKLDAGSDTEFAKIKRQITRIARRIANATSAELWSYDAERGEATLEQVVPSSAGKDSRERTSPPRETTDAALRDRWICVPDVSAAADLLSEETRERLVHNGVHSFQGVSLAVGAERLGVLYLDYKDPRVFSASDREAALSFAGHAALALKKAQTFDQVNRARYAAKHVASLMATVANLDQTLHSVADLTRRVLGCDAVTLYEFDHVRRRLRPPVLVGVRNPRRARRYPDIPSQSLVWRVLESSGLRTAEDAAKDEWFRDTRFRREEAIISCMAVPLRVGRSRVGAMFVNYRRPHRFVREDLINTELFANQAAVAIRNAQLYDAARRQARILRASYEASRTAAGSLDLDEILTRIAEQAWHLTAFRVKGLGYGAVWLIGAGDEQLVAAFPKDRFETFHSVGADTAAAPTTPVRSATVRHAIETRQAQISLPDRTDVVDSGTGPRIHSELAVPIRGREGVLGVIHVAHAERAAFMKSDLRLLEPLAAQATVAIQNVRQYGDAKQAQAQMDIAANVTAIGVIAAEWRHCVGPEMVTLRNHFELLASEYAKGTHIDDLKGRFEKIREQIWKLVDHPPFSHPRDDVAALGVNDFVRRFTAQWKLEDRFADVDLSTSLMTDDLACIHVNETWATQAFEHLARNGLRAMRNSSLRRFMIATRMGEGGAEIDFTDTGCGVPEELRDQLFLKPVQARESGHLGWGLLIVRAIAQLYGGDIRLAATSTTEPTGTTMRVRFPVVRSNSSREWTEEAV